MLSGQASDKICENSGAVSEHMLNYVHRHKTADMLEAAVVAGALVAGADPYTVSVLRKYSEKMGLLFQITDDLLDVIGDTAEMGKTLGKDASEGKLTFVTLYGVETAKEEARKAADDAKKALIGFKGSGFLEALTDNMLNRSK